ncbi:FAD/NAD(P)-binding protein [Streptomyces sp. NPDC048110]|uniref:FAD/NAD(P)-binding protein n=1 Tax=Streptomyces sp. NPDC048110 TaxID=3155483 RepID=UPI003405583E
MSTRGTRVSSVAVVGAGPRGAGIVERLIANCAGSPPGQRLHIDVIDPFPAGAGRVWRTDQSPLMLMNVAARNVTMFTDESVRCDGPIRPGPTLQEWAGAVGGPVNIAEGWGFADRATHGRYLSWAIQRVIAERPESVTVTVRETTAERACRRPDGTQELWLSGGSEPLTPDVLVLAIGHLGTELSKEERVLTGFAERHGLFYMPPSYTAEADFSRLPPGEHVAVCGMGLGFIDLMMLLTEGRGGRFESTGDGRLRYLASGREPVLHVGSRRGVPYRAKLDHSLVGPPPPLPRFFAAADIGLRCADRARLDFYTDLWPFVAKEVAWAYYHELFHAVPERTAIGWDRFATAFAALSWDDPAMSELIERSVPNPAHRFDFATLDAPLAGVRSESLDEIHDHVLRHVTADVDRMTSPDFSAELGAYLGMLSVHAQLAEVVASGKVAARPYIEDLRGWWFRFFEYASSGPPSGRLRKLLALAEAGIVRFMGAGIQVTTDDERGVFVVGSQSVEQSLTTTGYIDSRLPSPNLHTSDSPLLSSLVEDRAACSEMLTDANGYVHESGLLRVADDDFRILDCHGVPQPDRFALGPYTSVRHFATFARPRANALSFRQNDVLARSILRHLGIT